MSERSIITLKLPIVLITICFTTVTSITLQQKNNYKIKKGKLSSKSNSSQYSKKISSVGPKCIILANPTVTRNHLPFTLAEVVPATYKHQEVVCEAPPLY